MLVDCCVVLQEDKLMIEKPVEIKINALGITTDTVQVTEYRESEGVYVYDLYANGELVAKSRYVKVENAPFEVTQEEIDGLNVVAEVPQEA